MPTPLEALQGVANASQPLPGLFTAGQPGVTQFEALKAAGMQVILDIRDPMESRSFDEPSLVRGLGMDYENVSVRQGALDDATMEAVLGVLRRNEARMVLVHCASANRVGGALIPYFMIDRGMSEDAAIEAAMRIGLRGTDLLEWGLEYAHRRAGG